MACRAAAAGPRRQVAIAGTCACGVRWVGRRAARGERLVLGRALGLARGGRGRGVRQVLGRCWVGGRAWTDSGRVDTQVTENRNRGPQVRGGVPSPGLTPGPRLQGTSAGSGGGGPGAGPPAGILGEGAGLQRQMPARARGAHAGQDLSDTWSSVVLRVTRSPCACDLTAAPWRLSRAFTCTGNQERVWRCLPLLSPPCVVVSEALTCPHNIAWLLSVARCHSDTSSVRVHSCKSSVRWR